MVDSCPWTISHLVPEKGERGCHALGISGDREDAGLAALRAAGCEPVLEEHASGADRSRPVLARLLRDIRAGETLVVVRLDRLARSVGHLLAVIEQLEAAGAHFRSLRDPIDTATAQGMFSLQVLGAVAQLERALLRDNHGENHRRSG